MGLGQRLCIAYLVISVMCSKPAALALGNWMRLHWTAAGKNPVSF